MTLRRRMNLDQMTMESLSLCIMGDYGAGKTHLMGDFLRWVKNQGKPYYFINFAGQDGAGVVKGMGLGDQYESIDDLKDLDSLVKDLAPMKLFGLGVDGLRDVMRFVIVSELGELRYPDPKVDGERAKMLWGSIKMKSEGWIMRLKSLAPYLVITSPIDKGENTVTGGTSTITPDLVGKSAFAAAGWFDYVGLLTTTQKSPTLIERKINFAMGAAARTRQRAPVPIVGDIMIPQDCGGWEAFYARVEQAMGRSK